MISVELRKRKGGSLNHQPFEDWLLNERLLTPIEKRDLDLHIRICRDCAALGETGLELHSVRAVSPMPGFVSRFEKRLAARRIANHRRKTGRLVALLLGGAGLLFWLTTWMQLAEAGRIELDRPVMTS